MTAMRLMVLAAAGLALAGCNTPTPLYSLQKVPPPYRKAPDGAIIDNAGVKLDAEGYRLDKSGRRIQEVDIQAKTANQTSNPVAGYYISSIGTEASGNVMTPSEGAGQGYGTGPGAATMVPGGAPPPSLPAPLVPTPGEAPPATPTPMPR
ncbi:hypothetical protein [Enhydrobacter sp.]|jgi:hypothetical protein|uniref:hypothetical protein n=1 Tax=Enhydrobacter sp. TaxID=1894999 RepID=UPI00260643A4|nr:hypothetical protein [Enhydrobacter sp.]WIM14364.1 MAG: hypothetical protein OJF58_005334 [Enhydrobacter sp.]